MKLRNQKLKYNLQFFADKGDADQDSTDNSGDGDDNQDEDDDGEKDGDDSKDKSKKSDKKGKYFTQEEIDNMITERLKRERKEQKKKQARDEKKEEETPESKSDENKAKLTALEEKVLCYDHDIAKEYVKEAIALAKAYVDEDTDMDEALDLVIKKFPQFVKGAGKKKSDDPYDDEDDDTDNKKAWGQRQRGSSKKIDGVEAAFLRKNPGLKID